MAISRRVPGKLRDALGSDAAEELVTILDELRAERAELRSDFARLGADLRAEIREFRHDMDARFDRVDERFQTLERRVGDVKSDLMKWSFVFWVGAVSAIAMLARILEP